MTNNQFISVLRDYATASRRKRKSYAMQVYHWISLWDAAVSSGSADAQEQERLKTWARDVAVREYGRDDASFGVEAVG